MGRLAWVMENFFEHDEKPWHEIGMYFLMALPEDSSVYKEREFLREHETIKLIFRWLPLGDLGKVPLFPSFLREGLRAIPEGTEHVVHEDPKCY